MTSGAPKDPSSASAAPRRTVVVTGATGYIGGRLVPRLLAAGCRVVCLVREPRKLDARPWRKDPNVAVHKVDLADANAVAAAMHGADAAYYLVHSMIAQGRDYRHQDLTLARAFAHAANAASVGRIIYLGGLGEMGQDLSEHLT